MTEPEAPLTDDKPIRTAAMWAYLLILASPLLFVTALVGLVIAYVYRDDAPEWLKTHFTLQIRTIWIGTLYSVIAGLLLAVRIGLLMLPLLLIWFIVRCIKGLRLLSLKRPYPNSTTWWF